MLARGASGGRVQFADQQLDDYVLENSVLKSKLHSKNEALSIMSKELDKCAMERDRYRLLVEQLKNKHPLVPSFENNIKTYRVGHESAVSGGELLARAREQNNMLKLEVETLRSRCEETTRDAEALRSQLRYAGDDNASYRSQHEGGMHEELVQQLEKLKNKHRQLQHDLGAALDEKEELSADRDYYKTKVLRLNHKMSYILAGAKSCDLSRGGDKPPPAALVDIDAILMENKYLQERLTQLQVEKEIVKQTLAKYKNVLENRNKKASFNFDNGNIDVMTQQQVKRFLEKHVSNNMKAYVKELRSLCLGLFESLNDKSIALQHQRKTNRILANRISDLEKTLESWSNGEKYIPIFPSQMLLEEFCPNSELAMNRSETANDKQLDDIPDKTERTRSDSSDDGGVTECHTNSCQDASCHIEIKSSLSEDSSNMSRSSKIILPPELEQLVREALEQMRPGV